MTDFEDVGAAAEGTSMKKKKKTKAGKKKKPSSSASSDKKTERPGKPKTSLSMPEEEQEVHLTQYRFKVRESNVNSPPSVCKMTTGHT